MSSFIFLCQMTVRIALFLRKSAERKNDVFPLPFACQARFGKDIACGSFSETSSDYLTPLSNMKTADKPAAVQLHFECSLEAKLRFNALHEALGFKTKVQTFEAIVYFVSTKDKIDPAALERIEADVKETLRLLESFT
ncbi:MAG: hypothetical protein J0I10_01630 [Verrucomicrobia bacterium]|nr:hypothetical protein [Verrucomicrobiota bacterium]